MRAVCSRRIASRPRLVGKAEHDRPREPPAAQHGRGDLVKPVGCPDHEDPALAGHPVDLRQQLVDVAVVHLDGPAPSGQRPISSMNTIDGRFARARSKS